MNFKNIPQFLIILVFLSNLMFGMCGRCNPEGKSDDKQKPQEKSNARLTLG